MNTVQEYFNKYRDYSMNEIEKRAEEINEEIDTNPNADVKKLNIEIEGLMKVKENILEKKENATEERSFNPITQMNFKEEVPTENIFDTKEYRLAFFKKMLGQELTSIEERTFNTAMEKQKVEGRANNFNTATNSSAVLPTQTLNEVIRLAKKQGGLLAHVRSFNMPTKIAIPIGTPHDKAQWHTEGKLVDAEIVETATVQFDGYEIIKVFSISAKAHKMSIQAFESYVTEELTSCVMEAIADAVINGTGKEQGTGLLTGVQWNDTNTLDLKGEYLDFTKALAKLKRGYSSNAKFAMSNATLYNTVYSIVDNNNRPIFLQDPRNESVGHILGKEVIIDDHIDDGVILLGDFKYMGVNISDGMMLEVSRESSFRSGLIDYRAMAIADTKPLVDEAFIKLTAPVEEV
ncbi:phage major capsid protein [Nosocomiicoccus massiliensis]|uniref:Phage major capsid protein n=1 Tax=Nosocomiicoccus massiliensis TaxID=1232430 RepID=A0AAF1BNG3_9STAP|nr:phage major capsid protein [Nosocomiicoccus massiliensis]WOS96769.1 phage major capsid protein [Nosocomiicoccus massiliensis]